MNKITVQPVKMIKGKVKINGSKNASLPIICASLLLKNVIIKNLYPTVDILNLLNILRYIGSKVKVRGNKIIINNEKIEYRVLDIDEVSKIRGSYYLIPIFLYLFNKCEIKYPGGCSFSNRPIDMHIELFKEYGCIVEEDNLIKISSNENKYFSYKFLKKSVGCSINAILLGLSCEECRLYNLNIEPECLALIDFLNGIGFNINKDNDNVIIYKGSVCERYTYKMIPDRIEVLTYTVVGLLYGRIVIKNVNYDHIKNVVDLLIDNDFNIRYKNNKLIIKKSKGNSFNINCCEYPGIPTDIQPILGVLMSFSNGVCEIKDSVYNDRLDIYYDILKVNDNIKINNGVVSIKGINMYECFSKYECKDIRHSAGVVILSLGSGGIIDNVNIINRGYYKFIENLRKMGAKIY